MKNRTEKRRKVKGTWGARTRRAGLWGTASWAAFLFAAGCGGSDEPQGPQTRTVSKTQEANFSSIQGCISASSSRDTCLVYPGIYTENINFQGKAITVRSSAGPEETTIDGGGEGTVVTFNRNEGDDSVMEGFTITNGLAVSGEESIEHGGGIQMISAGPTIRDCILLENRAEGDGGGIYCFSTGSSPEIRNVVFQGNAADSDEEGGGQGGGICALYGTPELTNCLFSGNVATDGGAISARYQARVVLNNCTVADNSADQAGAVYLKNATVETTNSIYWNNSSDDNRPVVMEFDDRAELYSDTVLALSYLDLQGGAENIKKTETCSSNSDRCCIVNEDGRCIVDENELEGMLDPPVDPLFVERSEEDPKQGYYLSQTAAGQPPPPSPCVDAGNRTAEEAGLEEGTTRTDGVADEGDVDLGYHYAVPTS
jgi:predicted outer membrane repeat protein